MGEHRTDKTQWPCSEKPSPVTGVEGNECMDEMDFDGIFDNVLWSRARGYHHEEKKGFLQPNRIKKGIRQGKAKKFLLSRSSMKLFVLASPVNKNYDEILGETMYIT